MATGGKGPWYSNATAGAHRSIAVSAVAQLRVRPHILISRVTDINQS